MPRSRPRRVQLKRREERNAVTIRLSELDKKIRVPKIRGKQVFGSRLTYKRHAQKRENRKKLREETDGA